LRSNAGQDNLPQWLDEGLAQYFESLQVIDGQQVLLGISLENRVRLLRRSNPIPLKTFFLANTAALQKQDDAFRELFYAQAWMVVHYLMQNAKADRPLDKFVTLLGRKDIAEDDLKLMFQVDFGSLETALSAYITQPALSNTTITLAKKIAPDTVVTATAVSDSQADAYLGDLLAHGNRPDEGELFLRRAVAAGEPSGIAEGSLGALLIRQGKFAEARKLLQKAVVHDRSNFLTFFNLAYAISHEKAGAGGKVSKYSPDETKTMRDALQTSIKLAPGFAESYHLLAFIDFVNDENPDEAVAMLKKGIALKADADEFKILLAQVLLTQDKYDEAKNIAEGLVKAPDAAVRSDAESVLRTVGDYVKARLVIDSDPIARSPWTQSLIVLKRSWLTQSDLDQIELDRQINNLNIILERPRPDEKRMVGTIENVVCANGEIDYVVRSQGRTVTMMSKNFASVRTAVWLEGENSFVFDCGVSFAKMLAVLAFRPPATASPKAKPQLASVSFVPDFFVLKTPEELASARAVVVEDDGSRKKGSAVEDLKPEARFSAIAENLRVAQDGELRVVGVLEKIDCADKSVTVTGTAASGKEMKLFSASPETVKVAWFSSKTSQIPLVCGTLMHTVNAVVTFRRAKDSPDGFDGELISLEFVPEGFSFSEPER
jgi:tetratricopeptide (TPR) repeat protein